MFENYWRYVFWNIPIERITIPEGVKRIGKGAFEGCRNLKTAVLPENLQVLEDWCFSGAGLTSVDIPKGVESVGRGVFSGCVSLSKVTF